MTIGRRMGFSNTPHYGAGTGAQPAFRKIDTWGMVLSNNNSDITYNVVTNLPANLTMDYEFVGANVGHFHSGNIAGTVTLDANSSFVISESLNVEFDYANVTNTIINLKLTSQVSNATIAIAPDLIVTQAVAPNISGGNVTQINNPSYGLNAEYTLHTFETDGTLTIHSVGSNVNLDMYVLSVGGGSTGISGSSVNSGRGGSGGEALSANVTVSAGFGGFAGLNPGMISTTPTIVSANSLINGVTMTTDAFRLPANVNIADGDHVVPVNYYNRAQITANVLPDIITVDYNGDDLYAVKNVSASNVSVSVFNMYTDSALTIPSIKDPANVWHINTDPTATRQNPYEVTGLKLDGTGVTSWDVVVGDGGTYVYQPSPAAYIPESGNASLLGNLIAKPGLWAGVSGSGFGSGAGAGSGTSGGGGGAGGAGQDATLIPLTSGNGGVGATVDIVPPNITSIYYGGGGGGGRPVGGSAGAGGTGGGGGIGLSSTEGRKGEDGRGGGGSGGDMTLSGISPPFNGGSGIVRVRYMSKYRTLSL